MYFSKEVVIKGEILVGHHLAAVFLLSFLMWRINTCVFHKGYAEIMAMGLRSHLTPLLYYSEQVMTEGSISSCD